MQAQEISLLPVAVSDYNGIMTRLLKITVAAVVLALLSGWGTPDGDITGNGITDVADLLAMLSAWGPCS